MLPISIIRLINPRLSEDQLIDFERVVGQFCKLHQGKELDDFARQYDNLPEMLQDMDLALEEAYAAKIPADE